MLRVPRDLLRPDSRPKAASWPLTSQQACQQTGHEARQPASLPAHPSSPRPDPAQKLGKACALKHGNPLYFRYTSVIPRRPISFKRCFWGWFMSPHVSLSNQFRSQCCCLCSLIEALPARHHSWTLGERRLRPMRTSEGESPYWESFPPIVGFPLWGFPL